MIHTEREMKQEIRESMRGGTGSVTIRHIFTKDEFSAKTRLCARLTIPPGASIGPHQHETEDEVYIITRGTGVLNNGINETKVARGDAILTGNGESHSIKNDGVEDLELIAVIMCY